MATTEATAPAKRAGELRNYILVTAAYWSDTLTDGAIRMLVLFYFYQRGYTPSRSLPARRMRSRGLVSSSAVCC